jgi:hypothetical protein
VNFAPGQHSEKSHHHTMGCCTTDPSQSAVEHTQLCATQADVGRHLMHCICFLAHSYSNAADSSAVTDDTHRSCRGVGWVRRFVISPARNLPIDFLSHRLGDYRRLGKFHSPAYPCREWTTQALDFKHGHMTIIGKPSFSLSCT